MPGHRRIFPSIFSMSPGSRASRWPASSGRPMAVPSLCRRHRNARSAATRSFSIPSCATARKASMALRCGINAVLRPSRKPTIMFRRRSAISQPTGPRPSTPSTWSPVAADRARCPKRSACSGRERPHCRTTSMSFCVSLNCGTITTRARRRSIFSSMPTAAIRA